MKILQQPLIWPKPYELIPAKEDIRKYLHKMPRQSVEIVFFGSDSWVIPILQALEDNFAVSAVVTASDSAISNYFKGLVLTPDKLDEVFIHELQTMNPELFVVASYGKLIPQALLDIPKYGALNVHPSLLPKYRGASPVPATILNGDKITGVTIIKMDEKMDHGPIIATRKISLSGKEDFIELINKLFQFGGEILVRIIPDYIVGRIKPHRQNHAKAVFCHQLKRKSGYFDINNPPSLEILDRMIRAYYPWPGVWTHWKGKIVKFLPGGLLQMEGKKVMPLKDFLNGYPDFPIKSI